MSTYYVTVGGKEHIVVLENDGKIFLNGKESQAEIQQTADHSYSVVDEGIPSVVVVEKHGSEYHLLVKGKRLTATVESDRTRQLKKFGSTGATQTRRLEIHAPMPALVVKIEVQPGDDVHAGQGLIILEAMKMENEIKAHGAGKVREIYVTKGTAVEKGELLMLLE